MAYLKPQAPVMVGDDHVYPLTTMDQVIKPDGTRLSMDDLGGSDGPSEACETAERLRNARTIELTGAVTGRADFDGSRNIVIKTTGDPSGIVTSVNGASGAVTVATIKKWSGTLKENSVGYFDLPSGVTIDSYISGFLNTTKLFFNEGCMNGLTPIYMNNKWMLARVDGRDTYSGNYEAIIYYLS